MKRIITLELLAIWMLTSCATFTPQEAVQYYRVKHDNQLELYNYKSRTADENWSGVGYQTPEVVPLFVQPKPSSGTHRTKLNEEWEAFIDALNGFDEGKLRYLKANNTALFNNAGFPQLESLTMGGNVIIVEEIQGEWGRVKTLDPGQSLNAEEVNYISRPDLIHKFVVVGWNKNSGETYWTDPPRGDIYWPLVSSRPVWIPLDRLEKFPDLPITVTANTTLYIQDHPDMFNNPTSSQIKSGESVQIVEYYPSASNVWGRLKHGGWIVLLWYTDRDKGPQYPTSWKMETLPPPP